jgi:hypothetical protein
MAKFAVSIQPLVDLVWKRKTGQFEFESKLNQVNLPFEYCRYMMKKCKLHSSGYSDTRDVTEENRCVTRYVQMRIGRNLSL